MIPILLTAAPPEPVPDGITGAIAFAAASVISGVGVYLATRIKAAAAEKHPASAPVLVPAVDHAALVAALRAELLRLLADERAHVAEAVREAVGRHYYEQISRLDRHLEKTYSAVCGEGASDGIARDLLDVSRDLARIGERIDEVRDIARDLSRDVTNPGAPRR